MQPVHVTRLSKAILAGDCEIIENLKPGGCFYSQFTQISCVKNFVFVKVADEIAFSPFSVLLGLSHCAQDVMIKLCSIVSVIKYAISVFNIYILINCMIFNFI
jgi:hypothetical protein